MKAFLLGAGELLRPALEMSGVDCSATVEGADLVVSGGPVEGARGRLWLLATNPGPLELLTAAPEPLRAGVTDARWVLCPDERTRGLIDAVLPEAARRSVVLPWSDDAALVTAVEALLRRSFPSAHPGPSIRVVVAGHALHFLDAVLEDWASDPAIELRIDRVESFARHDEAASLAHIAWADVVLCEWASPVAAFYSRHKRPGQRLVVRLHRAELYSPWWKAIAFDAVDRLVCVSAHYADLTGEITGWPPGRITVVPNYVDATVLARPKLPGAEYALGLLGAVPRRKRLDLALDVVEALRARDPRFTLFVKTRPVWDVPYAWRDEQERAAFDAALDRVRSSDLLADGVVFDDYGPDVGAWLRRIGWLLSTSDDESFHLAPAEAMASGGVPVLRDWPGVGTIYDAQWVLGGTTAMVEFIAVTVEHDRWRALADEAQRQALTRFDVPVVTRALTDVLRGVSD